MENDVSVAQMFPCPLSLAFCIFFAVAVVFGTENQAATVRLLAEAQSSDGTVKAALSISPAQPRLCDTVTFTLEVQSDSAVQIEMPEFGSALGDLQIIGTVEKETVLTSGKKIRQLILTAVPQHGGKTPIWAIPVRYINKESSSVVIPATEIEIQASVFPESASLDDIPDDHPLFEIQPPYFLYIISAVVISVALALFFWILFRRKTEKEPALSDIGLQETALRRLALLLESRLYETDVKAFYTELTALIRWYIEQQTEIRAPELTTEEFLHEIASLWQQRAGLPAELQHRLRLFLESSDLVKFAKFKPTQEETMNGFRRAEEFITQFPSLI